MARPESVALGGYYPTPLRVIPMIAALIDAQAAFEKNRGGVYPMYNLADPCAGDGAALVALAKALFGHVAGRNDGPRVNCYGCEMEAVRADGLRKALGPLWYSRGYYNDGHYALHGDAFNLDWRGDAQANLLYLNPPYDDDVDYGRLEHRFLTRFTGLLRPGKGILVFVVPGHALAASAAYLAQEYEGIACYRFPDPDYAAFKQAVLIATRRAYPSPLPMDDSPTAVTIRSWAANPRSLTPLTLDVPYAARLPEDGGGSLAWQLEEVDLSALYAFSRPFMSGKGERIRPLSGLGLDTAVTDIIGAKFPVVMPPRPAHVAISLASGLVNGREVAPDTPGLPHLLVKGVFQKEFKTVEEKTNKDGDVRALVQVQQPRLTVSVLDMDTWTYHDQKEGAQETGATAVSEMNIADLLHHYGRSLGAVMHDQCPPLHDPADPAHKLSLPPLGLLPFHAQAESWTAALKMLFTDKRPFAGENPFILGEVGTGKTLIALGIAEALSPTHYQDMRGQLAAMGLGNGRAARVRKALVMCPPHLVASWEREVQKILPGARTKVLQRISDVREAMALPPHHGDGPGADLTVFLLSREMAKLGHAWNGGADGRSRCPSCGTFTPHPADKLAKRREVCQHRDYVPQNEWARLAVTLAAWLAPFSEKYTVRMLLPRHLRRLSEKRQAAYREADNPEAAALGDFCRRTQDAARPLRATPLGKMTLALAAKGVRLARKGEYGKARPYAQMLFRFFMAFDHPERDDTLIAIMKRFYRATMNDKERYGDAGSLRSDLVKLLLLVKDTSGQAQTRAALSLRGIAEDVVYGTDWHDFDYELRRMRYEREGNPNDHLHARNHIYAHEGTLREGSGWREGDGRVTLGTPEAALKLFDALLGLGQFSSGKACGTPLYTAVPEPRRFPLATYIARYAPDLFDLLILDEAHEYSTDGSAQERAAHRLSELGKPTLILTGTSNNGYASSLFMNMWALSRRFRQEFGRDDLSDFVTRYGYRKVVVEPEDGGVMPANYGVVSDRVDTGMGLKMRRVGEAPGVLPLFVLKHMLPVAVTIHKDDLDIDLPPMREIRVDLTAAAELVGKYRHMRDKLMERVMDDLRNNPDLAGKLWGQVAQIPTYLDRAHADTGNADYEGSRRYEVRYPVSVGGALVSAAAPLSIDEVTEKEAWLLDTIEEELAEGRPCMVLVWNTRSGLAQRLERMAQARFGKSGVVTLDAARVQASKRQAWIDSQVVAKRRKVLIVNPRAVETGLNSLVYFPTAIWYQNPNCSSIVYTQANGRIHRPGQETDEVRVYVPTYADTTQEIQLRLLGHKVAAAKQTDGLDISSALIAAGADGDHGLDALTVGKAIYKMLLDGTVGERPFSERPSHGQAKHGNGHAKPALVLPPMPLAEETRPAAGKQMRLLERPLVYGYGGS